MRSKPNRDLRADLDVLSAEANGLPLDPALRERVLQSAGAARPGRSSRSRGGRRRRHAA